MSYGGAVANAAAEAVTRQIRESIDVVEFIGQYVSLKRRGGEFVGLCPFHQEKTPSFSVSPSKQIFKCFGCGAGGDVFTFVQLREKVEFLEARRLLAHRAGIALESWSGRSGDEGTGKSSLFGANEWARGQFQQWLKDPERGKVARDYVERRRLAPEMVEAFGLGFSLASWDALQAAGHASGLSSEVLLASGLVRPQSKGGGHRDTFYNRLMFPILDVSGRTIGFGGRTLGDDRAKYLNTPETAIFDKGRSLYGLQLARNAISQRGRVIVVEGYTDCMMAHQFGFAETVATLGTALTASHVQILRRYTDNAYLVFDSDEAGSRAADRGLEVFLTQQLDVKLVQVPEGKDPCDFLLARGPEAFESLLNGAASALEFKWGTIRRRYGDADSGPGRREAIEEFLTVVATSAVYGAIDPIQRGLVVNQLSKLLAIEPSELYRQLGRFRQRVSRRARGVGRGERVPDVEQAPAIGRADAEQVALREVLEVLINEPGYVDRVDDGFDVSRFEDRDLVAVAATVVSMARELGEFGVGELIERMKEAKYARIITDLQQCGEARQNFEATLDRALQRLGELKDERSSRQAAERLYANGSDLSREDQDSLLETVAARAKRRKGPLPLSMTSVRSQTDPPEGDRVE